MSHWTIWTAGVSRPPMSNVRAILPEVREPLVITTAAGATLGAGDGVGAGVFVGVVVELGAGDAPIDGLAVAGGGLGVGGFASSTVIPGMRTRAQPGRMVLGSKAGDSGSSVGCVPRFHQPMLRGVVWN